METRKIYIIAALVVVLAALSSVTGDSAESPVSPFAGSEALGEYEVDFERLAIAVTAGSGTELLEVEGELLSHIYRKPESKTNLEVFRSYESALADAGFDVLLALDRPSREETTLLKALYSRHQNAVDDRPYKRLTSKSSDQNWLHSFPDAYISASREQADGTTYVAVFLGTKRNLYMVDVMRTAAMETGTVTITEELLAAKIAAEGKVAVYDIFFETDSAELSAESTAALDVIGTFLGTQSDLRLYVVGHTDDSGGLEHNMELSARRAASVVEALKARGIAADRLEPRGVGPLAPVATNRSDDGRTRNRRVELVQRR